MHSSLSGYRDQYGQGGAVLLELLGVVFLFMLFIWGLNSYSTSQREKLVVSDALSSGVRAIVMTRIAAGASAPQIGGYARWRYSNAIAIARYIMAQNGLNPDNYNFNVFTARAADSLSKQSRVQFNISARADADGLLSGRRLCMGGTALVEGVVPPVDDAVVDPAFDASCRVGEV